MKKLILGTALALSMLFTQAQVMCDYCSQAMVSNGYQYGRVYNNTDYTVSCRLWSARFTNTVVIYPYTANGWVLVSFAGEDWWYECVPI